jgi:ABC-type glycerol-3-phosphate transport system substrate-binding protein
MIASKKLMSWMLVATVFATTAAACSSDSDSKSDSPAATTVAGGDTPTTVAGGTSGNAEVTAFCDAAKKLGEDYKKVMADPTSGDIGKLTTDATALTTQAATLSAASPADANTISACLQEMSTAMTGG